jgi:hypothetical protein
MREGWLEDEYVILFEEGEAAAIAEGYGVPVALPGPAGLRLSPTTENIRRPPFV